MSTHLETAGFLNDLNRVAQSRIQLAEHLDRIVTTLRNSEGDAAKTSGQFGLEREMDDLAKTRDRLREGVFRLLVLGDMKRGKSTVLNALLGENLLPSDVNPCTALLTVLKYGSEKRVTIHFKDAKAPEEIDFQTFKSRYTIDPQEAKQLEQNKQLAFPDVSHAVVEYPLALLEKGVEIVDSPGLNDTEARNELSLGYVQQSHAVLFVMRASQPCTLAERRYLENYIKERNLAVFFLINAWDQVKESLIDPEDAAEVAAAEAKLHKVFRTNLADYCQVDGFDVYEERVFPISALVALRRRMKDIHANLEGTGFPEFMGALNTFLTQERAIAEFRQVRTLTRQVKAKLQDSIERRSALLDHEVTELKDRIQSVEPEFQALSDIGEQFRQEIQRLRDRKAREIADSFRDYVFGLEHSFDQDFLRYQPATLGFLEFFNQGRRAEFNAAFEQAFQQYVNDKFFAWSLTAEKTLTEAFSQLAKTAQQYGTSYQEVTDRMTEKLTGRPLQTRSTATVEDHSPGWAKWAMGLFSLATGNLSGMALAAGGFDVSSILLNLFAAAGIAIIATSVFGIILGPISLALIGLGFGAFQAEQARKEFAKVTKRELVKHLPQIAQQYWPEVYSGVQDSFETYEMEVITRIQDDIRSRKQELDNLLHQKQVREINREAEVNRLQTLGRAIALDCEFVDEIYQSLLS
jgi:GTPase SAR1 family protein